MRRIGLPADDQTLRGDRVACLRELRAEFAVAEHLRQLAQDLQVQVGRLLRHQQDEDQVHRTLVRRLEGDGSARAQERADRFTQALARARAGWRCPGPARWSPGARVRAGCPGSAPRLTPGLAFEQRAACSNTAFLSAAGMSSTTLEAGSSEAIRLISCAAAVRAPRAVSVLAAPGEHPQPLIPPRGCGPRRSGDDRRSFPCA